METLGINPADIAQNIVNVVAGTVAAVVIVVAVVSYVKGKAHDGFRR